MQKALVQFFRSSLRFCPKGDLPPFGLEHQIHCEVPQPRYLSFLAWVHSLRHFAANEIGISAMAPRKCCLPCRPKTRVMPHLFVSGIQINIVDNPSGRSLQEVRTSSSSFDNLLTCDELISNPHNSSVIALTFLVDTPCTYISAKANFNALSERMPFSKLLG
jgi:hypothetical protein